MTDARLRHKVAPLPGTADVAAASPRNDAADEPLDVRGLRMSALGTAAYTLAGIRFIGRPPAGRGAACHFFIMALIAFPVVAGTLSSAVYALTGESVLGPLLSTALFLEMATEVTVFTPPIFASSLTLRVLRQERYAAQMRGAGSRAVVGVVVLVLLFGLVLVACAPPILARADTPAHVRWLCWAAVASLVPYALCAPLVVVIADYIMAPVMDAVRRDVADYRALAVRLLARPVAESDATVAELSAAQRGVEAAVAELSRTVGRKLVFSVLSYVLLLALGVLVMVVDRSPLSVPPGLRVAAGFLIAFGIVGAFVFQSGQESIMAPALEFESALKDLLDPAVVRNACAHLGGLEALQLWVHHHHVAVRCAGLTWDRRIFRVVGALLSASLSAAVAVTANLMRR